MLFWKEIWIYIEKRIYFFSGCIIWLICVDILKIVLNGNFKNFSSIVSNLLHSDNVESSIIEKDKSVSFLQISQRKKSNLRWLLFPSKKVKKNLRIWENFFVSWLGIITLLFFGYPGQRLAGSTRVRACNPMIPSLLPWSSDQSNPNYYPSGAKQ